MRFKRQFKYSSVLAILKKHTVPVVVVCDMNAYLWGTRTKSLTHFSLATKMLASRWLQTGLDLNSGEGYTTSLWVNVCYILCIVPCSLMCFSFLIGCPLILLSLCDLNSLKCRFKWNNKSKHGCLDQFLALPLAYYLTLGRFFWSVSSSSPWSQWELLVNAKYRMPWRILSLIILCLSFPVCKIEAIIIIPSSFCKVLWDLLMKSAM